MNVSGPTAAPARRVLRFEPEEDGATLCRLEGRVVAVILRTDQAVAVCFLARGGIGVRWFQTYPLALRFARAYSMALPVAGGQSG